MPSIDILAIPYYLCNHLVSATNSLPSILTCVPHTVVQDGETKMFYEIVIAPSYTPEGLETLKGKSKNLRILEAKARGPSGTSLRQVAGGWLLQDADSLQPEGITFKCMSEAQPTEQQLEDLKFAWR